MALAGKWRAAPATEDARRRLADPDLDDSAWELMDVPGHWRSNPAFAGSDGPVLYRSRFANTAPGHDRRVWLTFEGIFYQADVWLDGSYLGDTEGYFFPHTFEVTGQASARADHALAVEVACPQPEDPTAKRNLTGVFQHWDCIERSWNPGGIWAPVVLSETGLVRISALRVLCTDAGEERATLRFEAELDACRSIDAVISTVVGLNDRAVGDATATHHLSDGGNRLRWQVDIERPELWWPHALGAQPLHDVEVTVRAGDEISDSRALRTGLRQVRMRNFVGTVNGERLFLKGSNLGPTRRALGDATPDEVTGDIRLAREAGLDLVRVHAHVGRRELYDEADRTGMLLWQDLPLQWGYSQVRRQAVRQAREAVSLLGHHPSLAVWCAHNEPMAVDFPPGGRPGTRTRLKMLAGQNLPGYNRTALDRGVSRALSKADGSRPVVAHSGVAPGPAGATDSHLYAGWYKGDERDLPAMLRRLPALARFVSEFGAQAAPSHTSFVGTDSWPELDWRRLEAEFCIQKDIFDERVPPADYPSYESWASATQAYQADLIKYHVETLRRLKYRPTGGFCHFLLADSQPAITWSVLDHQRRAKQGYQALREACAPVIVVADRPARSYTPGSTLDLDVHVVSDLRRRIDPAVLEAELIWPGGSERARFSGDVPPDSCVRVGRLRHTFSAGPSGPVIVSLTLSMEAPDGTLATFSNRYESAFRAQGL